MGLDWSIKRIWWKVYKYLDIHKNITLPKYSYYGNGILDIEDTGIMVKRLITTGEPFVAARIGGSELRAMVSCQREFKSVQGKKDAHNLLHCLSGFYGDEKEFDKFSRLMEESLAEVDMLGVWFNQMEDFIINRYCHKDVILGRLAGLEPWYDATNPWTSVLKDKKVLVIHPFKDSILAQYEKRERLFEGTDILPRFELTCIKAVQTLMGEPDDRFPTWFDALDYMAEEASKVDFDIALIACGAYGLPLAVKIKKMGKQAIHMGGALQLLFGVRGKRWDNFELLEGFYNDAWQYPLASEHLGDNRNSNVENGCYW